MTANASAADSIRDLWSLIEWRAGRSPDEPLAFDEHDRQITFSDFCSQAEAVAAGLVAAGLEPGTRIAWILPTRIESLILTGALARLDCDQIPLMPTLGERELKFILAQSQPDQVIVGASRGDPDHGALARAHYQSEAVEPVRGAAAPEEVPERVIDVSDALPVSPSSQLANYQPSKDDRTRWVFYTSGTTSHPKGVLHSDGTLTGGAIGLEKPHLFESSDRVSLLFPYAHIGGPTLLFSALRVGHALILVDAFDPEIAVETLSRHGITFAGSGPAFWQVFIAAQRASPERVLFPRLRALIGGGAAKPAHLHAEARQVFDTPIVSGYGSTECPGLAYNHIRDPEDVLRTDGRAVEGVEIRIVVPDSDSLPVANGVDGEIRVRGPMLARGYLGAEPFPLDDEGFFRTGDLGRLDSKGQLVVTGRIKDIIIRKGENISAKEIEDLLGRHPLVAEVAVIGLPDRERGERCCAVVVPISDTTPLTLRDVTKACELAGLMKFKHPEQLEVVTGLPRNRTGKILKSKLRERFNQRSSESND